MEKVNELLNKEIEASINCLSSLKAGSEERAKAIDDLTQLYKLRIEENKVEVEEADKVRQHKLEVKKLEQEVSREAEQRKNINLDRWVNVGVQVGLAVIGYIAYDIWHRRGLKFEETGTITSPQTRNLISRMLPGKK